MEPSGNTRRWTRLSGAGRQTVFAAAAAAIVLIAVLAFLAFHFMKGERQAPGEVPVAKEIELRAPAEKVPAPGEAGKAPPMEAGAPAVSPEGTKDPTGAQEVPGASVTGKVSIAGTSKPAPGMMVVVRKDAPSEAGTFMSRFKQLKLEEGDRSAASAADGRYRIAGIPRGEYRIFALRGSTAFVDIPPAQGKRLAVAADLAPQTIDIEVNLGGTIFGKVLDGDEDPIAGAKVSIPNRDFLSAAFEEESDFQFNEVVSKEDGSYRMTGLPVDKRYLVIAEAKDKAKEISEEIAFTEEEMEIEMDLILLSGSTVSGRVVGPGGEPVPGVTTGIHAEGTSLFLLDLRSATTDAGGAFRFEHIPAGSYVLNAGSGAGREVSRDLVCDGETEIADIVLTLPSAAPSGDEFSGRVVDDTGAGLPGVQLQLAGFVPSKGPVNHNTTSLADGTFAIKGVAPGIFNLVATHEKYAPFTKVGVTPAQSPMEVRMDRVAAIRGTVSSRAGDPIAGAVVKLTPVSKDVSDFSKFMAGQIPGQIPGVKTAPDGTFTLLKVVPGRARIRAEASGFAPGLSGEIEIAPGQEVDDVKLELSEGGSIVGVVLSPEGKPVADARVASIEVSANALENQMKRFMPAMLGGGSSPGARSEDDGSFKVHHLQEGKFVLTASHGDFSPSADLEVTLNADEKREGVKLRLRKLCTLRVVVREKEKAIPDLMVQVMGAAPMKMSTTDQDGKAEFAGLPPGDYLVQIMDVAKMLSGQGLGMRQKSTQIIEGQALDLEFVLGVGAKVQGKVIGKLAGGMSVIVIHKPDAPKAEEMDMADFQASFRAAQYNVGMGFIAADGTYTIPDIPDGDFIIEVPRMPADFTKVYQMSPKERVPLYRKPLKVEGGRDMKLPDIRVREDQEGEGPAEPKAPEPSAAASGD